MQIYILFIYLPNKLNKILKKMTQFNKYAIITSFFALWLTSFISSSNEILSGFFLILTFGILHGSNDLIILKKINAHQSSYSYVKLLFIYLLLIFFCVLIFYLSPILIISIFVLVSGYHFGEQQLEYLNNKKPPIVLLELLYGLLILFLIFEFHNNEVILIINDITAYQLQKNLITYGLYLILLLFVFMLVYTIQQNKTLAEKLLMEVFYLIVFSIIFKISSLIWGFAIYFIIWHSIPSIINQVNFLHGNLSRNNFFAYIKSASVYWVISLIGLAVFYFGFNDSKLFNSMFFSFLAAITFPHVLVIVQMLNKKK